MTARSLAAAIATAALLVALGLAADPASAIPAFARKYRVSCNTCHDPFPRLKPFGEEFAANGFRMPDPSQEPTRETYDTGDPLLQLVRSVPLAVRMEGFAAARENAAAEADFETPWVFKVLSGGPLAPKISYYVYFILEKGDVEGLEDAYFHFSKLFGSGVDLIFGQFQVSDPLFKRELRLERNDYDIYRAHVGAASANLTYDRGAMFFGTLPGDIDTVFTVVNGNGIPKGEFDNDSNKNLALRLARQFGKVRVGLFGYWGKEKAESGVSDEITYWGPDLQLRPCDRWELNLQYLERTDDDPFFEGGNGPEFETRGGFAELLFFPQGADGRWVLAALYNKIDSDDPLAVVEDGSLTLSYLARRNIRVVAEAGHDLERSETHASVGVIAAF
jgi:hypothetical protein